MPTPDEQMLDEKAVEQLVAVMVGGDSQAMYEAANIDNVRALCATVKQLREVNQEIINGITDGKALLHHQIESLQSQLEQLRDENQRLREQIADEKRLDLVTDRTVKSEIYEAIKEATEKL